MQRDFDQVRDYLMVQGLIGTDNRVTDAGAQVCFALLSLIGVVEALNLTEIQKVAREQIESISPGVEIDIHIISEPFRAIAQMLSILQSHPTYHEALQLVIDTAPREGIEQLLDNEDDEDA